MIRAILAGTKTVTRRVLKIPPGYQIDERDDGAAWPYYVSHAAGDVESPWLPSPYGERGDRLWVRETTRLTDADVLVYDADRASVEATLSREIVLPDSDEGRRVISSIHMRREWSRITLEVVDVRVERLHAITEDDAKREGIEPYEFSRRLYPSKLAAETVTLGYREGFHAAWDRLNGKRAPWASKERPRVDRVSASTKPEDVCPTCRKFIKLKRVEPEADGTFTEACSDPDCSSSNVYK